MPHFSLERLRRAPDVEAPNLVAVDATDRLILDEADAAIREHPESVVVIGDRYGALTLGAISEHGASAVRVHQDALVGELALARNAAQFGIDDYAQHGLDETLVSGARVVLLQLPKSLEQLDEWAAITAAHADPSVVVYAGGRVKHLTPAMSEVLGRHFGSVTATLARQKSRVLVARGPQAQPGEWPKREFHEELGLWVCAHGGAFAGTRLDIGTRFLLQFLPDMAPDAATAVDLGCGTGILAASLKRSRPELEVLATDQSTAAVASARATMAANGLDVTVVRDVGLASQPDASADLVLLNPPFHSGTTVDEGLAPALFADAARVLRPGGELWTVFNSHLAYRSALSRLVGETREAGRNAKFTVAVSRRT
ncbi:methyltransferase [Salinibacterium sp. SYSU T00001]|uniref:class I SAM-dependent methyltransferase n=1 Tax=Homoserinimonas sedimenticola TaxID=2986805 RepID=UPI0022363943|nr:class I SAM-dependent methyltransferase [Salinibacterium sedimenticola]MCW4385606.1 methyltransferase [Salinibacterium sedimenticola]